MIIENAKIYTPEHVFSKGRIRINGERIAEVILDSRENTLQTGHRRYSIPGDGSVFSGMAVPEEVIDAGGGYVLPGLIDLHLHGAAGADFSDGSVEAIRTIAKYEALHGIAAFCPAAMTVGEERLMQIAEAAGVVRLSQIAGAAAELIGIRMEGPFLNPERAGAQNREYLRTAEGTQSWNSPRFMEGTETGIAPGDEKGAVPETKAEALIWKIQERSGGLLRIVDVAPEIPGGMELIKRLTGHRDKNIAADTDTDPDADTDTDTDTEAYLQGCCAGSGIRVSLAHTAADYEAALSAFAAGAAQLTHLFNAMPGIHHRTPGPVIAAMEAGADVEVISDGAHVHPAMVRFAFRTFGAEHILLISDSMRATGMPDGIYELGGQQVKVQGRRAVLLSERKSTKMAASSEEHGETLAGSVTNLYDCMRRAVMEMGVPVEDAVRAASENPARALGIQKDYGSIAPGKFANLLLTDRELNLRGVILRGQRM